MSNDQVDARLADEYRAARIRMSDIAAQLDPAAATSGVPACPAWTTSDLLAHVTALAVDLGEGRRPDGDTQAWVDAQVADRRGRTMGELVAEWETGAPAFEALVAARPDRWWGLVYDVLVHEQDLRGAVEQPGAREGPSMDVAVALAMRLLQGDLAKHGLPAFRLVTDDGEQVAGEGEVELTLVATPFEALRLLGSRRTIDELRAASFEGDLDRYLPGLLHMDLPARDLGE